MGLEQTVRHNLEAAAILHAAGTTEQVEFDRLVKTDGLRAALDWRDNRFGRLGSTVRREMRDSGPDDSP
jgi:hypothetical protein